MDFIIWIIVSIFIVFLASQYVLGPIMVYFNQTFPEKYQFKLLDQDEFLSERGEIFNQLHHQICSNHFRYVSSSELLSSQSSLYFSIYYSEKRKLTCSLVTAQATLYNPTTQIEFTQMYSDGTFLSINNNSIFSIYPKWDIKESYRYVNVNDFEKLLHIMDQVILARKQGSIPQEVENGLEFQLIEKHLNDELHRLIQLGWVSSRLSNGQHRLMIKGALFMTWKMCWPIKSILNKYDLNKARNVLKNNP